MARETKTRKTGYSGPIPYEDELMDEKRYTRTPKDNRGDGHKPYSNAKSYKGPITGGNGGYEY
jgi:hypothetical protein